MAEIAARCIAEVTGTPRRVVPSDDGWTVDVVEAEVVENRRTAPSADMSARYEIEVGLGVAAEWSYRRIPSAADIPARYEVEIRIGAVGCSYRRDAGPGRSGAHFRPPRRSGHRASA
ncbi:hypothetical protein [Rhodococcus koreensis]